MSTASEKGTRATSGKGFLNPEGGKAATGSRSNKPTTLKTEADFAAVLRKGSRITGKIASARVLFKRDGFPRLGVAPKKTLCCAVKRNRIRRLFKEAFREEYLNINKPADAVIFPTDKAIAANYGQAVEFIRQIFLKTYT